MGINEGNDGTKIYTPKRFAQDIELNIFVLYHEANKAYVKAIERKLQRKKINIANGLADTNIAFNDTVDIISHFDYMVVVVSEELLEDLDSLDLLLDNYFLYEDNPKILPLVIWKELYDPNTKVDIVKRHEENINAYKEKYANTKVGKQELKRMTRIHEMLESFVEFATIRDKKTNTMSGDKKILNYIFCVSGINVADRENDNKNGKNGTKNIFNVSGGQVNVANDGATINACVKKE